MPAAANSAVSSALSVISAGNGQLNPAVASRFNVNRTVRFGADSELPLREQVASALLYKAATLGELAGSEEGELGGSEESNAVYDDVVERFGDDSELSMRELIADIRKQRAISLLNKGLTLKNS